MKLKNRSFQVALAVRTQFVQQQCCLSERCSSSVVHDDLLRQRCRVKSRLGVRRCDSARNAVNRALAVCGIGRGCGWGETSLSSCTDLILDRISRVSMAAWHSTLDLPVPLLIHTYVTIVNTRPSCCCCYPLSFDRQHLSFDVCLEVRP